MIIFEATIDNLIADEPSSGLRPIDTELRREIDEYAFVDARIRAATASLEMLDRTALSDIRAILRTELEFDPLLSSLAKLALGRSPKKGAAG